MLVFVQVITIFKLCWQDFKPSDMRSYKRRKLLTMMVKEKEGVVFREA